MSKKITALSVTSVDNNILLCINILIDLTIKCVLGGRINVHYRIIVVAECSEMHD